MSVFWYLNFVNWAQVGYLATLKELRMSWDQTVTSQKLKEEGEAFKKNLNTQEPFEDWKLNVHVYTSYSRYYIV